MQNKLVLSMLGRILILLGVSMLLPLLTSLFYEGYDATAFLVSAPITTLVGFALYKIFKVDDVLRPRSGFLLVTSAWVAASVFGSLPYMISGVLPNFVDAMFETMSGFTTTGATVFTDIEVLPHGILLWRSQTQWLGGMGIVVLFVALLSSIGSGGVGLQVFKAEAPGPISEKIKPRISDTAKILWLIYFSFTVVQAILLWICGMSVFDAVCHAFTTTATGGFSTKNASMGYYANPAIDWITIIFMFLSGVNFSLYFYVYRTKQLKAFTKSQEFRWYLGIVVVATLLVTLDIWKAMGFEIGQALTLGAFQVVSVITTTGFITYDYELWPQLAQNILIFLMFVGACSGSTSGSMKVNRYVILLNQAKLEFKKAMHPRMITQLKIGERPISEGIVVNVAIFFFVYMGTIAISTMLITGLGIDFLSAFTSTATTLGNVGPGIGVFGPTEPFAAAPILAKIIYTFLMLLGRLELYTVLVILSPYFWKK